MSLAKKSALQESRQTSSNERDDEFRLLVEAVSEYAIFQLDPQGHVVTWNVGAETIKGYSREEITGKHFSIFYSEADRASGTPEKVLESAARDGSWKGEGWRIRKDGDRFWADVTITALYDEEGNVSRFAKVTRDMTARHEQQERLEKARQQSERKNALLQLMQTVAAAANDADRLEEAMDVAVRAVCETTGWPVGHGYRVVQDKETRIVPTGIRHVASEERFGRFGEITSRPVLAEGENLPGRAAASGKPVWIPNVTAGPHLVRPQPSEEPCVRGAFAVPVHHQSDVVAVLEFFSAEEKEPDETLLEAMRSVAVQLSRVAERERAQEELRRSEDRYRRLFEEANVGIGISTPKGRIIDVNPALQEMLGYTREELLRMDAADLYVDPEQRRTAAERMAREGAARNLELNALHKNGQERILEASATVQYGPNNQVAGFLTFVRDITERKRAEEELQESEAKFRVLAEKALVGIGLIQENVYRYVNPELSRITGYAQEELIGYSPEKFVHPEDRSIVMEQIQQRLAGDVEESHYQIRLLTKGGEVRLGEVRGSRIVFQGKPATIGMLQDITERTRAEEALRESETRFRALAENAPVGILVIREGRLEYANAALARMYGYKRDELTGRVYADTLVHPGDRQRVAKNIGVRLGGDRTTMYFRFRGIRKGGEPIHVDAYGTAIEYQGAPAIIGMDIDVTDRIGLQRQVLNMQEEERRRLGREIHDGVASQLTNVALMLDLISRRVQSGKIGIEDLPSHFEALQERLRSSNDDIRRLSRGLAPAGLSAEDLPAALKRLAEDGEGTRFVSSIERLSADDVAAVHLYRVAQEAVANARKHAEASTITIRLESKEHALLLAIEDDGKGFDSESVANASLGLRTMRYRAELLGGTLTIDSAPENGTCVRCRVPV